MHNEALHIPWCAAIGGAGLLYDHQHLLALGPGGPRHHSPQPAPRPAHPSGGQVRALFEQFRQISLYVTDDAFM